MTDTDIQAVDTPAPDANVPDLKVTPEDVNDADPSTAVNDADEIVTKAKGVGRRIDELTRLRRDAERDRDHWRELAMRQQAPPQEVATPDASTQPKTLADFEFNEAAYQAHLFKEATKVATQAARDELQAEQARASESQRQTTFKSREAAFAKDNPDYLEVTRNPEVPITASMAKVIAGNEDGPALAYHLAKNVGLAEEIAALPEVAQAMRLGEIRADLKFERKAAEEARKRVSKAPDPVPTLGALNAAAKVSTTSAESDALSDEEWVKAERRRTSRKKA